MEAFIDMIRSIPCLWDQTDRQYRDMNKKEAAWRRIVKELKSKDIPDVKTAKSEWKKLRDCHRDSIKRAIAGSNGQTVNNKWRYAERMDFLVPYMKSRQKKRRYTASSDEQKESSPTPSDPFLAQPSTSADNLDFTNESIANDTSKNQSDHKFRKRKLDSEFGEVLIDMDRNSQFLERSKDPLDSFFDSMCETTKQFPTWLQYSVKRKIFTIISEAEDTFENLRARESIF